MNILDNIQTFKTLVDETIREAIQRYIAALQVTFSNEQTRGDRAGTVNVLEWLTATTEDMTRSTNTWMKYSRCITFLC